MIRSPKNVLAGLFFIAVAGLYFWKTISLPIGTAFRMGPGYFPLLLEGTLALLGVAILVSGLRLSGEPIPAIGWRGLALVLGAVILFGLAVVPLGFLPALVIAALLSAAASRRFRLLPALAVTTVLAAFCWLVFIKGIQLSIPLFGPWLGGS